MSNERMLSQYSLVEAGLPEENMKPGGVYICPECKDATITWHSPVDKYKVRCPKCSTDLVRKGPAPVTAAKVFARMSSLSREAAEQYLWGPLGAKAAGWAAKAVSKTAPYVSKLKSSRLGKGALRTAVQSVETAKALPGAARAGRTAWKDPRAIGRKIKNWSSTATTNKKAALWATGGFLGGRASVPSTRNEYEHIKLAELAEIYAHDPLRARTESATAGVPIGSVIVYSGIQRYLNAKMAKVLKGTAGVSLMAGLMAGLGVGPAVASGAIGHRRAMQERVGLKKPMTASGKMKRAVALGFSPGFGTMPGYFAGRGVGMRKKAIPAKWQNRADALAKQLRNAKKRARQN